MGRVLLAPFYKREYWVREIHRFPKAPQVVAGVGFAPKLSASRICGLEPHSRAGLGIAEGGWPRRPTTARHQELQNGSLLANKNWIWTQGLAPSQRMMCGTPERDRFARFVSGEQLDDCRQVSLLGQASLRDREKWEGWQCADKALWKRETRLQEAERRRAGCVSFPKVTRLIPHPSSGIKRVREAYSQGC